MNTAAEINACRREITFDRKPGACGISVVLVAEVSRGIHLSPRDCTFVGV